MTCAMLDQGQGASRAVNSSRRGREEGGTLESACRNGSCDLTRPGGRVVGAVRADRRSVHESIRECP